MALTNYESQMKKWQVKTTENSSTHFYLYTGQLIDPSSPQRR